MTAVRDAADQSAERKEYVSALNRLRGLPEVFDLRDMQVQFGMTAETAAHYCWRWRQNGLVKALGPRQVGVYYNLLRDPGAADNRQAEAVEKFLRVPVVVTGASALHWHGWTTQRPHQIELAVPVMRGHTSVPQLNDLQLSPRYRRWFAVLKEGAEIGINGFLVARPAVALADSLLSSQLSLTKGRRVWEPGDGDVTVEGRDAFDEAAMVMRDLGADDDLVDSLLDRFKPEEGGQEFSF